MIDAKEAMIIFGISLIISIGLGLIYYYMDINKIRTNNKRRKVK